MKVETQGKRLAKPESPPSLGYDCFFSLVQERQKKSKQKKLKNGALKTKMREEEEDFLLGCVLLYVIFFVP